MSTRLRVKRRQADTLRGSTATPHSSEQKARMPPASQTGNERANSESQSKKSRQQINEKAEARITHLLAVANHHDEQDGQRQRDKRRPRLRRHIVLRRALEKGVKVHRDVRVLRARANNEQQRAPR